MIRLHRAGRVVLPILTLLALLALFAPSPLIFPEPSLDRAWEYAMNEAVAQGKVFGRDIVFTYGPYAAAYTHQFHPATDRAMVVVDLLFGLAWGSGLVVLAGTTRRWLALALPFVLLLGTNWRESLPLCLPLVHLLVTDRIAGTLGQRPRPTPFAASLLVLGMLTVSLSLLPLVKGSFSIVVLLVGACSFLLMLRSRAAIAWAGLALWLGALIGSWAAAGQPVDALPRYFASLLPIMSGYTEAMAIWSDGGQVALYGAAALVIVACCAHALLRTRDRANLSICFAASVTLFLAMKEGFVRHDIVHWPVAASALIAAAFLLAFRMSRAPAAVTVAAGLLGWAAISHQLTEPHPGRLAYVASLSVRQMAADLSNSLEGRLQAVFDAHVARIADENPLAPRYGTTDIYPIDQDILLANHRRWAPRPVIQSYSVYGDVLPALNADHLRGRQAPDYVYFAPGAIDGRLPSLGDGQSWLPLTTRYEVIGKEIGFAVLRHKADTAPGAEQILGAPEPSEHGFGDTISLPASGPPIWAEIDVKPTLLGKLATILFKPPTLYLNLRFADGTTTRYRYIANMGRTGFLLSPVVPDTDQFLALLSPATRGLLDGRRPVSMSLAADVPDEALAARLWQPRFALRLRSFEPPTQPAAADFMFDPWLSAPPPGFAVDMTAAGQCNFDKLSLQHLGSAGPLQGRALLQVNGWSVISGSEGVAPDELFVVFTAPDGGMKIASARRLARPDVGAYFGHPSMGPTGFAVSLLLPAGETGGKIRIAQASHGALHFCPTELPVPAAAP